MFVRSSWVKKILRTKLIKSRRIRLIQLRHFHLFNLTWINLAGYFFNKKQVSRQILWLLDYWIRVQDMNLQNKEIPYMNQISISNSGKYLEPWVVTAKIN